GDHRHLQQDHRPGTAGRLPLRRAGAGGAAGAVETAERSPEQLADAADRASVLCPRRPGAADREAARRLRRPAQCDARCAGGAPLRRGFLDSPGRRDVHLPDAAGGHGCGGAAAAGDGARHRLRPRRQLPRPRRRGGHPPPQLRQRRGGADPGGDWDSWGAGEGRGVKRVSVYDSVLGAIGSTPLIALRRLCEGLPGLVLAKLENLNPGGSLKDRIALRMIEAAEREGRLRPGGVVVELTSGNTGTGLAIVCAVRGYRFIAVMSEGNSVERRRMLRALGAEVALVPQVPGSPPGQVSGEDLALVEAR